jgi:DNA polymerase I
MSRGRDWPAAVIAIDFEWRAASGCPPEPLCLVSVDSRTGIARRYWADDLRRLKEAPFPTGQDVVVTSFSLASDLVNFAVLGWRMPRNLVCGYAEHRCRYNGTPSDLDDDLIGALARRDIPYLMAAEKEQIRRRALDPAPFTEAEKRALFEYCEQDARGALALLQSYIHDIRPGVRAFEPIWWERALFYGAFARDAAIVTHTGIPMDVPKLDLLRRHTDKARLRLTERLDTFGVYRNGVLKNALVWEFARRQEIIWPATAEGRPVLENEELKALATQYPIVEGFRQLLKTVRALRRNEYAADRDGRSHVDLFPFATKTGRCAPKGKAFIYSAPAWMRGLVKPAKDTAIAYLDFESEEFAFAGFQSGDEMMVRCYLSGDPYMAVGIAMGIAPVGATKQTHPLLRDRCKTITLGVNYGMQARGLARRLGISEEEAGDLLAQHRRTFPRYWAWIEGIIAHAKAHKVVATPHGWSMYVPRRISDRTLINWPQQALGGDLLRLATMALLKDGVQIDTLVHDALLIEGPKTQIRDIVESAKAVMVRASEAALGMPVRVDAQIFRHPKRFYDKRSYV